MYDIYLQIDNQEPKQVLEFGNGIGRWSPAKETTKPGDSVRSYLPQNNHGFCVLQGVTVKDAQIGERLIEGIWAGINWVDMPNGNDLLLQLTGQL